MSVSYFINKIGRYAYTHGVVLSVLKSTRSDEEKLKLIREQYDALESQLSALSENRT